MIRNNSGFNSIYMFACRLKSDEKEKEGERQRARINRRRRFMRKIYAVSETCSLIAEAHRVLCHLVMFTCLFALDLQNEIQLLSTFFCYSWLAWLLGCS